MAIILALAIPASVSGELLRGVCRGAGWRGAWCSPAIFIDGLWVQELNLGQSIADAVPMGELLAVEIYQWLFYVPHEYQGWGDCGVVLFWTQRCGPA